MDTLSTYEHLFERCCDFVVSYRFFSPEEGGRKTGLPTQGYKPNFMYNEHPSSGKHYMIFPEFIDENNEIILEGAYVAKTGKANMWIVNPEFIQYHKEKIKIGVKGYFMEGGKKIAECEVIAIIGLT